MKRNLVVLIILALTIQMQSQEIAQWRGEHRDGKYNDTGLLKKWPDAGPKLLWHFDELGDGHASAAVTNELIYTAGTSEDDNGFVIAINHSGEKVWKTAYGKEWVVNWDGVRSTPLVYGDKVYIMSSYGELVCLNAKNGAINWKVDLFTDYDGRNIQWGVTENLLIDGNKLFVTPGGINANVIALHKDTAELIWESKAKEEQSAYCSPLLIKLNNKSILVTQTANSIIGIDAASGKLLWSHEQTNRWSVHANTPLYHDGKVYCSSGYGKGGVMLKLSDDGNSITELWRDELLDDKMGGMILLDGRIYGSGDANKKWFCIDWETGKEIYSAKILKPGNIIYADGLLYCYGTGGTVGIVDPASNDFSIISSFDVPYGDDYHWAHLVIHDKKLYVRHGTSLMVYDIARE